jgi:uncharacterized protein (TIGR00730 family)
MPHLLIAFDRRLHAYACPVPEPRPPATPDEEILNAESPVIAATRTEEERLERIQRELATGFGRLAEIGPAVSVFGSARVPPGSPEYEFARRTARMIGESGLAIITGGGPGVMEAANRGAQEAGVASVGLNIELPFEQETNPYVDVRLKFHYFFTRKVMFVRFACGFVVFPGGFGTLDEMFEALTLIQTDKVAHFPLVLAHTDYWRGLLDWVRDRLAAEGKIAPADPELMNVTDEPEEIVRLVYDGACRSGVMQARPVP